MNNDRLQVRFWGVRGSIPVSGPDFSRYGGNTACIEIRCGDDRILFDAGSGLREAGPALAADGVSDVDLFLSHCHYDHIIGLPFFDPIYLPSVKTNIWSGHLHGKMTTRQMVEQFISPPWFPLHAFPATVNFRDFSPGQMLTPRKGITIRTLMLNHPGGAVGYRIEWRSKSVALVYDVEHSPGVYDPTLLELMEGADLVVYDCTYNEDEMQHFRGFGHSSWQHGIKLAQMAHVRRFAMFHHAPSRTDQQLAEMERSAKLVFPGAFAAYEGQIVEI